jgi:hypothetical protein
LPVSGAQTGARPALRVRNAMRQGPAGPITYKFDIAAAATFSPILVTATVAEGVNETGFIPPADLPIETSLFWRATAIDATNAAARRFSIPLGPHFRRGRRHHHQSRGRRYRRAFFSPNSLKRHHLYSTLS